jgi:hypothetical protein
MKTSLCKCGNAVREDEWKCQNCGNKNLAVNIEKFIEAVKRRAGILK